MVSVIDACREKYYFRSRVLDASVELRLSPEKSTATKKPFVFTDMDEKRRWRGTTFHGLGGS